MVGTIGFWVLVAKLRLHVPVSTSFQKQWPNVGLSIDNPNSIVVGFHRKANFH